MKSYSEMSDAQLNRLVGVALGSKVGKSSFGTTYFKPDFSVSELSPGGPVGNFSPCNSWADAGPIIEKNRIGIEHDGDCWLCTCFSENGAFESEHDNPLRAAMIVFLMMQGSK